MKKDYLFNLISSDINMTFTITHKDKKTQARIGILKTKKKDIETPFFMPVATKGSVKCITTEDLDQMKATAVISNALILFLRPGLKVIKKFSNLGNFMNWKGVNFTDSGGFQMYSKSIYLESNDEGVTFKDPFAGQKLFITPEKDMEIQLDISSDVAMCLDSMPLYAHSKKEIQESVRKTTLWATRCKKHHDLFQKNIAKEEKQLLFGITQGGIHLDLREKSAKALIALNFDGYSIGGLGLGESREEEFNVVKQQKKIIPENKPIYLMGIGDPVEILEAISHGVDIFDSRMPTQNARRGTLFSSKGKIKIMNKKYELDKKPIDSNCDCYVCKSYSRAFIRHQLMQDEVVGKRLATFHNLYYLQALIRQAKDAIKQGKFSHFKEKVSRAYK